MMKKLRMTIDIAMTVVLIGLMAYNRRYTVVFINKELNTRMAGLLRFPDGFDLSKDYPAIVLTGPMLSVKEQAQSVYA